LYISYRRILVLYIPVATHGHPASKELEDDADRILDYERFPREAELVAESSGASRPHVHGMEDIRGNIFWAISSDASDSKIDEEIEITLEISKVALQ
jgi:hypothetical protein